MAEAEEQLLKEILDQERANAQLMMQVRDKLYGAGATQAPPGAMPPPAGKGAFSKILGDMFEGCFGPCSGLGGSKGPRQP